MLTSDNILEVLDNFLWKMGTIFFAQMKKQCYISYISKKFIYDYKNEFMNDAIFITGHYKI